MTKVHLPKPLHGWRAFAGEVGIIVLGVLIALAFGQIVQSFDDRSNAEQAHQG
jgi:large-conductance mechanosensitive channel